ncbi:dipeptide/oligopeptide transport system, inner membrane permease component [Desulforapulum autotrophicum HRM2]|uniref:Dipeptide/oligopeptide transport system, inner membrane permease component n=1 Tax=Desulforapulum autotrophicum (strain ATCC 43914 / DSM 3382 / VKM B-1955 / HRM2) TaxID=177437 RepID=C0QI88_DESAH|nr:ABC transporter permease subunit [Desulforapulum autotrophicum]ACN15824.1 dipeptide/oligopeptide transport system, inner membrane permease component [Desulforapulum autotrophicum HRM2]
MIAYFIRRLFLVIPTFIGITIMVFTITRFVPGGPIERIIADARQMQTTDRAGASGNGGAGAGQPLSEEQIEKLRVYYGFDRPVLESYFLWLSKVLTGDLGRSTRYYDPVWEMIKERIPISLYFGVLTMVIVYGVCIPLGIAKAVGHKSGFDNFSSILIFTGYAIPGWVAGVMMLVAFASWIDIFPLGGLVSDGFFELSFLDKAMDLFRHTLLPLLAYVLGSFTVMTLLMKNTLMDNLSADYVRTAIAKGMSFKQAVFRHALQNSLIPIATHFGNNVSIILTGSFLIEKVFNINGMGLLGYESVVDRDYPVVMGILVISSLLFMLGNILSDLCVALVDPRVRFK